MAKNFRQVGRSITISGQTATLEQGSIYRRTGNAGALSKAWIGVVQDEIIGTAVAAETLDGRPITIGDGVSAELQLGDGLGDMDIEGVYTFALPTSGMLVKDSNPCYMRVADVTTPGYVASGVTNNQSATFYRHPISGALVGFAVGESYTSATAPFTGMNVVDVKLLGLPIHGVAATAPSAEIGIV